MTSTIVSVVGARPNFVKLAAMAVYLDKMFDHVVVHTGQHYDYEMSRVFFEQLDLREPDVYLGVGSGSHGYQVGEIIRRIEKVLYDARPRLVIVYGDTNSTLAGALAAVKAGFPVAHVEAGLRIHSLGMQEEINRRVTDHVSSLLFAPTKTAVSNLVREGVLGKIYLTGDVHVDVLYRWLPRISSSNVLSRLGLTAEGYVVVTIHRAENVDDPSRLKSIVNALLELSRIVTIVFPIHPRTRRRLIEQGLWQKLLSSKGVMVVEPLGYIDFLKLVMESKLVITDSGGVQREAYLLRKPVLILRDRTEWVEIVESGWARLVPDPVMLMREYEAVMGERRSYRQGLLGDGRAAERILRAVKEFVEGVE